MDSAADIQYVFVVQDDKTEVAVAEPDVAESVDCEADNHLADAVAAGQADAQAK